VSEPSVDDEIAKVLEEIQGKREAHDVAYKAQHLKDLRAYVALVDEYGIDRVTKVGIGGWKPGGAVTMVVAKRARKSDNLYKRFTDMVRRSSKGEKVDPDEVARAGDLLAESCILYPAFPKKGGEPTDGAYEATLELTPGLLSNVAAEIVKAAMGKAAEEGKG
jgi:hypothetical protein